MTYLSGGIMCTERLSIRSTLYTVFLFKPQYVSYKKQSKFHPRSGHEGPDEEYRYSSSLSLTSALNGAGCSTPRIGRFTPRERDPVPILEEAGWAPGPVWTDAENPAPNGIRSPERPVRSESLYRLRYPGPHTWAIGIYLKIQWTFIYCFVY
jgi:hypothetical protein